VLCIQLQRFVQHPNAIPVQIQSVHCFVHSVSRFSVSSGFLERAVFTWGCCVSYLDLRLLIKINSEMSDSAESLVLSVACVVEPKLLVDHKVPRPPEVVKTYLESTESITAGLPRITIDNADDILRTVADEAKRKPFFQAILGATAASAALAKQAVQDGNFALAKHIITRTASNLESHAPFAEFAKAQGGWVRIELVLCCLLRNA